MEKEADVNNNNDQGSMDESCVVWFTRCNVVIGMSNIVAFNEIAT